MTPGLRREREREARRLRDRDLLLVWVELETETSMLHVQPHPQILRQDPIRLCGLGGLYPRPRLHWWVYPNLPKRPGMIIRVLLDWTVLGPSQLQLHSICGERAHGIGASY